MPNGKTHDKITKITTPVVAVTTYLIVDYLKLPKEVELTVALTLSYIFAATMFSGDLDLRSKQSSRWGIFEAIWIPYRKIFKHRSKYTHGIIWGPIVRLLYLYIVLGLLWWITTLFTDYQFSQFLDSSINLFTSLSITHLFIFIGLVLGGASHTLADATLQENGVPKIFKKKKRRK